MCLKTQEGTTKRAHQRTRSWNPGEYAASKAFDILSNTQAHSQDIKNCWVHEVRKLLQSQFSQVKGLYHIMQASAVFLSHALKHV